MELSNSIIFPKIRSSRGFKQFALIHPCLGHLMYVQFMSCVQCALYPNYLSIYYLGTSLPIHYTSLVILFSNELLALSIFYNQQHFAANLTSVNISRQVANNFQYNIHTVKSSSLSKDCNYIKVNYFKCQENKNFEKYFNKRKPPLLV